MAAVAGNKCCMVRLTASMIRRGKALVRLHGARRKGKETSGASAAISRLKVWSDCDGRGNHLPSTRKVEGGGIGPWYCEV